MLYAKLTTGISYNKSKDPFNPQTVTLDYMFAQTVGYVLGSTSTSFNVYFGTGTLSNNKVSDFEKQIVKFVEVDGTTLSNWGTSDVPILEYIAGTFNLTVSGTYQSA
jgi:hypothetical protein